MSLIKRMRVYVKMPCDAAQPVMQSLGQACMPAACSNARAIDCKMHASLYDSYIAYMIAIVYI